nr:2-C-methyl-D-erythritol 4-phosphate cytidylyltransferase [Halofilum ochraceum]
MAFSVVVPAAGAGARMGGPTPKTYLPLAGRTVIEWGLAPLLAHPGLRRLVVALARDDDRFAELPPASDARVQTVIGGASRAASVAAGLDALAADSDGPVLVHDGARPCLSGEEIERLLAWASDPAGALLAIPVRDTLKRADADGRVAATEDRTGLWQALTPQLFHGGTLRDALGDATDPAITDEASAMERAGFAPRLVEGDPANIKITRPHDLPLAEAVLAMRGGQ